MSTPSPTAGWHSGQVSDVAVTVAASAVAAFADQHQLHIPPEVREDLARTVLTAAWDHLSGSRD
ncbi:hypothetical protein [Micromonospora sp. CPCC 206061]|uniref:hypothetical protein n=1 Tax=Micromonospora sp. CPCC 206061 TaxID=3122410 RepID=UPI002FEEA16A